MLQGHSTVFQALLGTFFTWGMTAAGAALVFVFSSGQVSCLALVLLVSRLFYDPACLCRVVKFPSVFLFCAQLPPQPGEQVQTPCIIFFPASDSLV